MEKNASTGSPLSATLVDPANKGIARLCEIMATLRSENGCPWDAEQTSVSLRPFILEEAYEVIDAISLNDKNKIKDELGDLLLQVVFQAQIHSETEDFTLNDVAETISEKLIRRHPHVFAEGRFENSLDLHRQWDAIKRQERKDQTGNNSLMAGLPRSLPALMKGHKILTRLARASIENSDPLGNLCQEFENLTNSIATAEPEQRHQDIGNLLLSLTDLARSYDCDAETALHDACQRTENRILAAEKELEEGMTLPPGERNQYGKDVS